MMKSCGCCATGEFPILGKMRGKVSNPWKTYGKSFQSLGKNRAVFPIIGKVVLTLILVLCAANARGAILTDNLPPITTNGGGTELIDSSGLLAQHFTTGEGDCILSAVTLYMLRSAGTGSMGVGIYTGTATEPNTNNLVGNLVLNGSYTNSLASTKYIPPSSISLSNGVNYWVVARGADDTTFAWGFTDEGSQTNHNGVGWSSNKAFWVGSWIPDGTMPFQMKVEVLAARVVPDNGPYAGGNLVLVTNAWSAIGNGTDITNIVLGGVGTTNITGQGDAWVAFVAPTSSTAGLKDLVVQSTSVGGTTLSNAYTVNPAGQIGGTAEILSDNLGNVSGGEFPTSDTQWQAQQFTTDERGGDLVDVTLKMLRSVGTDEANVRIFSNIFDGSANVPNAPIFALANVGGYSATLSNTTFTSSGLTLSPSSTYWVVLSSASAGTTFELSWTSAVTGTGVGFSVEWRESTDSGASWSGLSADPYQMQVRVIEQGAGVEPSSGSLTGGYQVVISGSNLGNGSDITNVTLCGVAATNIASQSATQVVIVAGAAGSGALGAVRVFSVSFGETVASDAFTYESPTLVTVCDVALVLDNEHLQLCWKTTTETETLGFDLYREEAGGWVKVNSAMIPAQGWPNGGTGASYCVADPGARVDGTYRYKLVEYETTGGTQEYGPFERSVGGPRLSGFSATPGGLVIQWLSRETEVYDVLKADRLRGAFTPAAEGLPATPPVNAWTDRTESAGAAFYRIEAR